MVQSPVERANYGSIKKRRRIPRNPPAANDVEFGKGDVCRNVMSREDANIPYSLANPIAIPLTLKIPL
jgi:hypothetical protein